ncbi:MAG TPA: 5-bromo-4-chloroindolyl phosphate hydrolysis family protein, partial [Paracoccus sp. (in: a-proteobacteria)]|nr:5-bromo-4-chloroindolyl phosphate hydrolysis family protein [Paracoccus sp. (in: a-proteobacteria)]
PGALAGALVLGFTAAILHWLAFGPDPMRDKGMEGVDGFQQDRAARMVAEAEAYLRGMSEAILRTGDRRLESRVAAFAATARDLFQRVEEDPAELAVARRYLGVYLIGARDATVKFADLYAQTRDPQARAGYEALLDDLERSFSAVIRRLHEGGRTDMDIEIEVLRERLAREGVAMRPALEARQGESVEDLFRMPVREPRR